MQIANVKIKPKPIDGRNQEQFYAKVGLQNGEERHVYAKFMPLRKLINEIISYRAAKSIGLPIPESFIVLCRAELFDCTDQNIVRHVDAYVGYASTVCGGSLLKRISHLMDDDDFTEEEWDNANEVIDSILSEWPHLASVICFDQWIANSDRNPGNLLQTQDDKIHIIYHESAFFSSEWKMLTDRIYEKCASELSSRAAAPGAIGESVSLFMELLLERVDLVDGIVPESVKTLELLSGEKLVSVARFLEERSKGLDTIFETNSASAT